MDEQVIRIERWYDESGRSSNVPRGKIVWALGHKGSDYTSDNHAWTVDDILLGKLKHGRYMYISPDDGDRFTVVPPEEWPEEVCVAMALRGMGVSDAQET